MSQLKIKKGDNAEIELTFTDEDDAVIDLTGGTVKFSIKKNLTDTNANAIYYNASVTLTTPASGIATVNIDDQVTKDFDAGEWYWQARLIDSTGKVISNDVGQVTIEENLLDDEAA